MSSEKSTEDQQPQTIEEHYQMILNDETPISPDPTKISMTDAPEWFDAKLFQCAQDYFNENLFSFALASTVSLVTALSIPEVLKVLIFTKKSSTPCAAFNRYLETVLHATTLYNGDFKNPNSKFYKSINVIRWKHSVASRRCQQNGAPPITQKDMVLIQVGFVGYILVRSDFLTLTNSPEQREAINHFWRVAGHFLGIPLRLNVCRESEAETTILCKKIIDDVYVKYLNDYSANFLRMSNAMLDGFWCIDFTLDSEAFMKFTYAMNGLEYEKPLSMKSWLNYKNRELTLRAFKIPFLGKLVRIFYNNLFRSILWLVERYPFIGWIRFGKDKCRIQLYPHGSH